MIDEVTHSQSMAVAPTAIDQSCPVMIELVGPAGCGKSETLKALRRAIPNSRTIFRFQKKANYKLILLNVLPLGLLALRQILVRRSGCRVCLHGYLFLSLMKQVARKEKSNAVGPTFYDEGPFFMISKLLAHECPNGGHYHWKDLEQEVRYWGNKLAILVVLDAPDHVLIHRIQSRSKRHSVKHQSDQEIEQFLAVWRSAIEETVSGFSQATPVKIVRFDTNEATTEEIVGKILEVISRR